MKCKYPIVLRGRAFGCGQCMPCRVNKRRIWTHRILLEASQYKDNAFVTLSYGEEYVPENGSLDPSHLRNYLKRLRRKMEPLRFRYFGVGEYGDNTQRPHYHLILFGLPTCQKGISQFSGDGICCPICSFHAEVWGMGNVFLGQLSDHSAAYTVGYVVKKMTKEGGEELAGRYPEFARMSNRPGIGAGFMDEVASALFEHGLDETLVDVPTALRHGSKILPLGRYLTRRLRVRMGRDPNAPKEVIEAIEEELRPLREDAYANGTPGFKEKAFREAIIQSNLGRALRVEGLFELRTRRKDKI